MSTYHVTHRIGAVAIGRNEGERLKRCLRKLVSQCELAVYVDSGSSDGSVDYAESLGVEVVELDISQPFSAARARNAGWKRLLELCPGIDYVQFVDGDCELVDDWLGKAAAALDRSGRLAVVCGRRRERYAGATMYNRMMDFEWNTPVGPAQACGGDALVRKEALTASGGLNESVVAGEEPEFCLRLQKLGWTIERIDAEMTLHDADMSRLSQWWRRQRRSGYGALDVSRRFGVTVFGNELFSARIWTVGVISAASLLALIGGLSGGFWWCLLGLSSAAAIYLAQIARLTWRGPKAGLNLLQSFQFALASMVSKFACALGQFQWWWDQRRGRIARQIEYKSPALTKAVSGDDG